MSGPDELGTDKGQLESIVYHVLLEADLGMARDDLDEVAEMIAEAIIASGWPVES